MVISNYVPVNTEIQNCAQYSVNMFYSLTTIYTVDTRGAILLLNNSYLYGNGQFLIVPVCISNVPASSLARLSLLRTFGLTFWTKFRIQNALPWTERSGPSKTQAVSKLLWHTSFQMSVSLKVLPAPPHTDCPENNCAFPRDLNNKQFPRPSLLTNMFIKHAHYLDQFSFSSREYSSSAPILSRVMNRHTPQLALFSKTNSAM